MFSKTSEFLQVGVQARVYDPETYFRDSEKMSRRWVFKSPKLISKLKVNRLLSGKTEARSW